MKKRGAILILGILLILTGIACNERVLAALFSTDGALLLESRIIIWSFDIFLIAIGLVMVFCRNYIEPFIFIVSVLSTIALIETYFTIFNPQVDRNSQHDNLFEYNSLLGWQFIPNKSGVVVLPKEEETCITLNSNGMRDREYAAEKPKGMRRIIVLGDSFVTGLGVEDNEVFTEVMEGSLVSNVEVINFGVNGFGPTQEYLQLTSKGFRYNPDIVLMVVYIRNDLSDLLGTYDWIKGYQRPRPLLQEDGGIGFDNIPVPLPSSRKTELIKSRIFPPNLLEFLRKRLAGKYDIQEMPPEISICRKQYPAEIAQAYKILEATIKSTLSACRKKNAEFVVIIAPSIVQVRDDYFWRKIKSDYGIKDDLYDLYLPNKEIKNICERQKVPLLDLTEGLKAYTAKGKDLYYPINQHWNPEGHLAAAGQIVDFLRRRKLLSDKEVSFKK